MKRALAAIAVFAGACFARVVLGPRKPRLSGSASLDRAFTNHRNQLAAKDELWSR